MSSSLQLNMYQNTDVEAVASDMERRKWVLTFCLQEVKDINYPKVGLFNSILNASRLKTRAYAHT